MQRSLIDLAKTSSQLHFSMTERNLNFPKIILFYWISTVLFYKLLLVSPFNEEQGTDILILLEILFI